MYDLTQPEGEGQTFLHYDAIRGNIQKSNVRNLNMSHVNATQEHACESYHRVHYNCSDTKCRRPAFMAQQSAKKKWQVATWLLLGVAQCQIVQTI